MNATTIPASGFRRGGFLLWKFYSFYAEDREQGRVTDRDRGHQVLANDRRGKGEGSRTFQRGDAKATKFLADFQAFLDFISNLWGLTADAIF